MNLSSNEFLLLALLFIALGFVLLQYGMVQGLLFIGLFGLFLLFYISSKIKAKDSVKLYSNLDKVESYLQFWDEADISLEERHMAILADEAYSVNWAYASLPSESHVLAFVAAKYSDSTLVTCGNFISRSKNLRESVASRLAYEKNLASGIYINEKKPKKILEMAAYMDFSSLLDQTTRRIITNKFKQNRLLNIVLFGNLDYAEFDYLISTFSRKGALCSLMLKSQRLITHDAEA